MNTQRESGQVAGIAGLPRRWAVAVQLVGTFGLAVFLVIYYVLWMGPQEAKNYENLKKSVDGLTLVVEREQALMTRAQAGKLEKLFILATAPKVADIIVEQQELGTSAEVLEDKLQKALLLNTDLLSGLQRKDGGVLSEMLTNKIIRMKISSELAREAIERWSTATRTDIHLKCEEFLDSTIRMATMMK